MSTVAYMEILWKLKHSPAVRVLFLCQSGYHHLSVTLWFCNHAWCSHRQTISAGFRNVKMFVIFVALRTSKCGRHEIHIILLKRIVQRPSGSKAEIRLYDCNLFITVLLIILLLIYIAKNIHLEIFLFISFYSVQRRNSSTRDAN